MCQRTEYARKPLPYNELPTDLRITASFKELEELYKKHSIKGIAMIIIFCFSLHCFSHRTHADNSIFMLECTSCRKIQCTVIVTLIMIYH